MMWRTYVSIYFTDVGSYFDHPVTGDISCNPGNAQLVVVKNASEVCHFHFEISDFPLGKMSINYNSHINSHVLELQY